MLRTARDRRLLIIGLIAALALVWRLAAGPHPVDDAYITFRYAANLLAGEGLTYNSGERVLGTSTPLTAILLAGIAFPFGSEFIPTASLALNSLSDAASVLAIAAISLRLRRPTWVVVGSCLLFALAPASVRYSIGGMETSLSTLTILSATYFFLSGREAVGAHLAGLGFLIRPDAVAIAAGYVWSVAQAKRRVAWRTIIITGLWIFGAVAAIQITYSLPLPQSVFTKLSPVYLADPMANSKQILYFFGGAIPASPLGFGARGLIISAPAEIISAVSFLFFVQIPIWVFGLRSLIRTNRLAWLLGLYPLIVVAVYLISGLRGSLMAEWYLLPVLPFWILPLLTGFDELLRRGTARAYRWASWITLAIFSAATLAGFDLGRGAQPNLAMPLATWEERELLYERAADEIRSSAAEGALVAAPEIGALGFHCDCQILDTVGLVSPRSLKHYPLPPGEYAINNAIPSSLIYEEYPDYIVSLEVFLRDTLLNDERFLAAYTPMWYSPTDAFGSSGMMIFRHRDAGLRD